MSQTITITGRDSVSITNSQGRTMSGWTWDGTRLTHPAVTQPWVPVPAMAARIDAAVASVVPSRTERMSGLALASVPPAGRDGFRWDEDMDSDVGMYVRTIPGSYPDPISYVPADFGK